jgi:hypothetical protein
MASASSNISSSSLMSLSSSRIPAMSSGLPPSSSHQRIPYWRLRFCVCLANIAGPGLLWCTSSIARVNAWRFPSAPGGGTRCVAAISGAANALTSGKTSAVNLIRHYLADEVKGERLAIVDFRCWWFKGEEALTLAFFAGIARRA